MDRAEEYNQIVFIIDHDAIFQSQFEAILKIKKEGGKSKIE